jgi:hypothetical protein
MIEKNKRTQVLRNISHIVLLLAILVVPQLSAQANQLVEIARIDRVDQPGIAGPFSDEPVMPVVYNGDLRDLPQIKTDATGPTPLRYTPGTEPKGRAPQTVNWVDPVAQTSFGVGLMPEPTMNFAGLDFQSWGSGWPPDTNGDVGPDHYIQNVNTAIGIYDKATGAELVAITFDSFFSGPAGTPCNNNHQGDPIVLYDPLVDRWVVTDFAWFDGNPSAGFYECIAVSQSGDPVSGGWYFYALRADTGSFSGYLNDYPKLGVWSDGWYMSANMFQEVPPGSGFGVRVWALDRASMIGGGSLNEVHFDCTSPECASLLPSNLRGDLPPAGSPNYFAAVEPPDNFYIWEFDVDWTTPGNSTFGGPTSVSIADFAIAPSIPQLGTSMLLDSLSFRLMMQLQYRNINGVESLWANHSVANEGSVGVRWYEVGDPGGTPTLVQQGTYQPDENYRWMGSLAVDQDGNMAVGYSVSSETMYPAIRYAGRLAGEVPGTLPQNETVLIQGGGSQTGINRWGDYSAMTVDPDDDCTFWYTTEYYLTSGNNWQTRIGSFKYPSCGQSKSYIEGVVRNSVTMEPVEGVPIIASSDDMTISVMSDPTGYYTMTLLAGTYQMTAGPFLPGYPTSSEVSNIFVAKSSTVAQDFTLTPVPNLVEAGVSIDDNVTNGNDNGYLEPGEGGVLLWEGLLNNGAITSTNIAANLVSLTPGLTIDTPAASYPDISAGEIMTNTTPFSISVANTVPCGEELYLNKGVVDSTNSYEIALSFNASQPLPRTDVFNNDVESGAVGWTTGGDLNNWAIIATSAHSPVHSWTDSPGGNYPDNANSWLRTPAYDLSGKRNVQISGWFTYALEAGYDYVYLDYSLDGGLTWSGDSQALVIFNGYQSNWTQRTVNAPMLDEQENIALRFRLVSDSGVNDEGIFIDDIVMSYEPYQCAYVEENVPGAPELLSPADLSTVNNPVPFQWEPSTLGGLPTNYIFTLDDTPVITVTSSTTSLQRELSEGTHTWKVTAFNDIGTSPDSQTWSVNVLPEPPDPPMLITPLDGSEIANRDTDITFQWEGTTTGGATDGFVFYVDSTAVMTFTTVVTSTTMTLPVGIHDWYVTAFNAYGVSAPSDVWSLEVLPYPPGTPLLVSPMDGASVDNPVIFQWQASATGGAPSGYVFILDSTPVLTITTPVTATTMTLSPGEHTWSVQATNKGGTSSPAEAWTISTPYAVYMPMLGRE